MAVLFFFDVNILQILQAIWLFYCLKDWWGAGVASNRLFISSTFSTLLNFSGSGLSPSTALSSEGSSPSVSSSCSWWPSTTKSSTPSKKSSSVLVCPQSMPMILYHTPFRLCRENPSCSGFKSGITTSTQTPVISTSISRVSSTTQESTTTKRVWWSPSSPAPKITGQNIPTSNKATTDCLSIIGSAFPKTRSLKSTGNTPLKHPRL